MFYVATRCSLFPFRQFPLTLERATTCAVAARVGGIVIPVTAPSFEKLTTKLHRGSNLPN